MSSAQNQFPKPPRSASSLPTPPDSQTHTSESGTIEQPSMDQYSAATLMTDSSALSTASDLVLESLPDTPSPTVDEDVLETDDDSSDDVAISRQHPIPPASEPMQYRAIGLVRGKYAPSEEQFTRGLLMTEDNTAIDAVLLGRVMSLVKKHLDLEQTHLWVVYPRTRTKDNDDLHVQIVGVWEPEKLSRATSELGNEVEEAESEIAPFPVLEDGYFSIRGEILFHAPEEQALVVKIQQSPKKASQPPKSFKLNLKGVVTGKTVGYFWDFNVYRQGNNLLVQDGSMVALVPPKKRKVGEGGKKFHRPFNRGGKSGAPKKPWTGSRDGQRPSQPTGDRPTPPSSNSTIAPPARRPIPKPVKRPKNQSSPD